MRNRLCRCMLVLLIPLAAGAVCREASDLERGFLSPPDSARPHTWWHWMNGNVTREGITADLEAMTRVGVGGAQIFNVGDKGSVNIPEGPAPFMSPQWLDLVLHAAKEADRLGVELCLHNCAGWSSSGGPWIKPEYAMQILTSTETKAIGPAHFNETLKRPAARLETYVDIAVLAFPTPKNDAFRLRDFRAKAGFDRRYSMQPDLSPCPENVEIPKDKILDLTQKMDAEGNLKWDVPEGHWTIFRIGYTPTGKNNHPAPPAGLGLECDKLSREALDVHWEGGIAPILDKLGALAGKSLNNSLIDSYEVGPNNWTPLFRQEFKKRRGYDLFPFLPAVTGRVVESGEISERFLWDFRRTMSDLFADNYFGYFAEKCHAHGLLASVEPYDGPFECLAVGAKMDVLMGEFWVGSRGHHSCKIASSTAHTHGRRFVGAEAFTAAPQVGRWLNHPASLKALGDLIWCKGINRYIFHRYAQQPWLDKVPGMTMGQWGTHFDRTNTWWEPGKAWMSYLARSQFLLQEGQFVGDVLFFGGEAAPAGGVERSSLTDAGFDYDALGTDLFDQLDVKEGRVTLPLGMAYRLLVLPETKFQTLKMAQKIRQLVSAGATVLGPQPNHSPSLSDYPASDQKVQEIGKELWGKGNSGKKRHGKGCVFWGKGPEEVLEAMGVSPDFQVLTPEIQMPFIHRRAAEADVYFVSNQRDASLAADCAFRVQDRVPELWHPVTGTIEDAPFWRQEKEHTVVSLSLDPAGSVFVVFRRPLQKGTEGFKSLRVEGGSPLPTPALPKNELKVTLALYGVLTANLPNSVDVTDKLRARVKDGKLAIAATNALAGDPAPSIVKSLVVEYKLDDETHITKVQENENLRLPKEGETGKLTVVRAVYGDLHEDLDKLPEPVALDVTSRVADKVSEGHLKVRASNALPGEDPVPLVRKQLRVDYELNGDPRSITVWEGETIEIPNVSWKPVDFQPRVRIEKGGAKLLAWRGGQYILEKASGGEVSMGGATLDGGAWPDPMVLTGPWDVTFPKGRGAPEKALFETLMSLTDHTDSGIRYFSGTATYRTTFDLPPGWVAEGRAVWLDLGRVEVMAEVRVNQSDLGVLWKNPFRVEITNAVSAGRNTLEIQVTNLWPNRIIGDEQLPADVAWEGHALREWPQWMQEGKPRSVQERVTFTTWKHWNKEDPLLPSGLMGPVQLLSAVDFPVPRWR